MGKLVLFLKDASPVEIPLAKERVTIGRRADNDVCLPYPAVSGEHAAVVTILADSFLEDLGSTNGTLVNGRPVAKHFLRDRDQIDIGRQLLVYVADNSGRPDPPASVQAREDRRELSERVAPAHSPAKPAPAANPIDDELAAELRVAPASSRMEPRPAPRAAAGTPEPERGTPIDAPSFDADLAAIRMARAESTNQPPPDPPAPPAEQATHARLRVLTGPAAGRVVPIARDEFVVGRVGVQVAAIVKRGGALLLVPREGSAPPNVNGEPVTAEGRSISPGDGFEVAGIRLELLAPE
jgi:pSer/pThr/pTyr-binding forkhead associated (FHA) protein